MGRRAVAIAVVALLTTSAGFAALSPKLAQWPKGPEQWLMTRDEQRAWKNVTTDAQAREFIDLFWARRDPTPGTPPNEYHTEFDARVVFTDRNFTRDSKRGSLTDPGRVIILLGIPKNFGGQSRAQSNSIVTDAGMNSAGRVGEIVKFEYSNPMALGLTGQVGFVEDLKTHELKIDFQQGNVAGAMAMAVERAIVSPGLKEVPEWAKSDLWKAPAGPAPEVTETVTTTTTVTRKVVLPPAAAATATPVTAGAHDLILVENVRAIRVGEPNPFGSAVKKSLFRKSEDVGFAYQFCTASGAKPKLTMSITFDATTAGHPASVSTPEEEVEAETITSAPGCYLIRGAIPLESFDPGSWTFYVNVKDPASGQSYNLQREFKIE